MYFCGAGNQIQGSCMLGKHSNIELHPQLQNYILVWKIASDNFNFEREMVWKDIQGNC